MTAKTKTIKTALLAELIQELIAANQTIIVTVLKFIANNRAGDNDHTNLETIDRDELESDLDIVYGNTYDPEALIKNLLVICPDFFKLHWYLW